MSLTIRSGDANLEIVAIDCNGAIYSTHDCTHWLSLSYLFNVHRETGRRRQETEEGGEE